MGVIGAMKRIMGSNPRKINLRNLSGYSDRDNLKVVIDGQSITCRYSIGSLNSKMYVVDRTGKKIPEIYYLFIIASRFIKAGITPVFVFDGRSPALKAETVEKRGQAKDKAEEMADEMVEEFGADVGADNVDDDKKQDDEEDDVDVELRGKDLEKYIKYLKRSYRPDMDNIENAKLLLRWMGVPVIDAPGEADSQCAAIAHHYSSTVLGVITDDFDSLMCGAPGVLKMPSLGSNTIEHFTLSDTLDNLSASMRRVISKSTDPEIKRLYCDKKVSLTHMNLIEIGCMMGTDYCSPGIRIKHSGDKFDAILEIYAKHEMSLEKVLTSMSGTLSQSYIKRILDSRDLYTKAEVLDPKSIKLTMSEPSVEMIRKLCSEFISDADVTNTITMLVNTYRSKSRKFDRLYRVTVDTVATESTGYGSRYSPWDSNKSDSFGSFNSYKARYARELSKNLPSGTGRSGMDRFGTDRGSGKTTSKGFGSNHSYRVDDSCHAEATKSWPDAMYRRPITITG